MAELEQEIEEQFLANDEQIQVINAMKGKPEGEKLQILNSFVPAIEAGETDETMGMRNAYEYDDPQKLEEINQELHSKYIAMPLNDDASSAAGGPATSVYSGVKDMDAYTERSYMLSQSSAFDTRSNISSKVLSKLSKPTVLPKEEALRDNAEKRDLSNRLSEVEKSILKAR